MCSVIARQVRYWELLQQWKEVLYGYKWPWLWPCSGSANCAGIKACSFISPLANPAIIVEVLFIVVNEGFHRFHRILQPFVTGSPFPPPHQSSWLFNGGTDYPAGSGPSSLNSRNYLLSNFMTAEHSGIYSFSVVTSEGAASVDYRVSVIGECNTTLPNGGSRGRGG